MTRKRASVSTRRLPRGAVTCCARRETGMPPWRPRANPPRCFLTISGCGGRVEIERRVGDPELAERLLHSPPVVTVQDRSQLDFLLGQIAAEKWRFTEAIGH